MRGSCPEPSERLTGRVENNHPSETRRELPHTPQRLSAVASARRNGILDAAILVAAVVEQPRGRHGRRQRVGSGSGAIERHQFRNASSA